MLEDDKKLIEYIKDDDEPTFEFRGISQHNGYCRVNLNFFQSVHANNVLAFNMKETDTVSRFRQLVYEYEGIPPQDQKIYETFSLRDVEDDNKTVGEFGYIV